MGKERKPKAVIVGGSIAGVSSAHALTLAGWDVVVLEKTSSPPRGSPTGAGLGLDPFSQKIISSWIGHPELLQNITIPLTADQNNATDSEKKISRILTRDEHFNFRAAHWADLHELLYRALPPNVFFWGHHFQSFSSTCDEDHKTSVKVKAKVVTTGEIIEIEGNLLIAADGCLSSIRQHFLPGFKLRYSGYCAWRGVLDFSEDDNSETIMGLRKAYPDLGKCLYFDLGSGSHSVFYELLNKRLNWIWYVNQPEPNVKGSSVTMKVNNEMIQKMHQGAENTWIPELVKVMKETKDPFINLIYDCDPLEQISWGNVVLVGDAAHPTTPHCLRSTNMSVVDAAVLGKCLVKRGLKNLQSALEEYQSIQLPVTSVQVLHARRLGRMKQGLALPDREPFNCKMAREEECLELRQKNTPYFNLHY